MVLLASVVLGVVGLHRLVVVSVRWHSLTLVSLLERPG
jgi:hypothetical protein